MLTHAYCAVTLPPGFPREKPTLSIQATVLARGSRTIARAVPGLPWGPRWTSDEFVKRSKYVVTSVHEFVFVLMRVSVI